MTKPHDCLSRRKLTVAAASLVLSAATLVGCSGEGSSSDGGSGSPGSGSSSGSLSDFAREVLSDGVVSRGEMDAARIRTTECLAADGFASEFKAQNDRISNLEVDSGSPKPGEADSDFEARFDAAIETCRAQFLDPVEALWLQGTAPSEEEMNAAFVTLKDCLKPYVEVLSSDADGLAPLFEAIDNASTSDADREAMVACYSNYTLATATGDVGQSG